MNKYFVITKNHACEQNGIFTYITIQQFIPKELKSSLSPEALKTDKMEQEDEKPANHPIPEVAAETHPGYVNYAATIVKVVQNQSRNGNDQVVWTYAYTDENGEKKTITQYTMINQKDQNKFLNFNLCALGLGGNGIPDINSPDIQAQLIPREVEIKIREKGFGSYDVMMAKAL